MNKNTEEIEERIDRFLQAEENESFPAFQDAALAKDIIRNHQDGFPRVAGKMLPYVTLGLAACLAFAFLPDFGAGDAAEEFQMQDSIAESLLDSDKELLEDLMALPVDVGTMEVLPDSSTLDLLALLDSPLE
ncbi:MAG TPA: hypothetical protein DCX67_11645 [Opitutae bacterium]|nr:hypothetical protein [Opitutae bacterium]|tara:strand:+ start:180 stop:575 length:396 start_codon:yes stop_codon:yes gene_type:complete